MCNNNNCCCYCPYLRIKSYRGRTDVKKNHSLRPFAYFYSLCLLFCFLFLFSLYTLEHRCAFEPEIQKRNLSNNNNNKNWEDKHKNKICTICIIYIALIDDYAAQIDAKAAKTIRWHIMMANNYLIFTCFSYFIEKNQLKWTDRVTNKENWMEGVEIDNQRAKQWRKKSERNESHEISAWFIWVSLIWNILRLIPAWLWKWST